MNTAIIAEYNPFHKGHLWHIKKTREKTNCDNIIAIISGNFVQRGEPSMFEKHLRTRHALLNGVDMVLELPVEYATGSADVFAGNAVGILDKCGIVDCLSFGSEAGSLVYLDKIAEILSDESSQFKIALADFSAQGLAYPAAREKALSLVMDMDVGFINSPNNILAIEYLTQLKRLNSKITPITVERVANGYNDKDLSGEISSATAIRNSVQSGFVPQRSVPENTLSSYDNIKMPLLEHYSDIFAYIMRKTSPEHLREIADVTEGIENRLYTNCNLKNINKILESVKTKRYTYTKLKRCILHILLDITKTQQKAKPRYVRVLGVRQDKRFLLNQLSKNSSLPVITSVKENEHLLRTEIMATDMYNIFTDGAVGMEYKNGIVII